MSEATHNSPNPKNVWALASPLENESLVPEIEEAAEAVPISAAPIWTRERMFIPFETPAAPLKRLNAPAIAPPAGSVPIKSIPVLKAPLARARAVHVLYQGVVSIGVVLGI